MDDHRQLVVRVNHTLLHLIERAAIKSGMRRIDYVRAALAYAVKHMNAETTDAR